MNRASRPEQAETRDGLKQVRVLWTGLRPEWFVPQVLITRFRTLGQLLYFYVQALGIGNFIQGSLIFEPLLPRTSLTEKVT